MTVLTTTSEPSLGIVLWCLDIPSWTVIVQSLDNFPETFVTLSSAITAHSSSVKVQERKRKTILTMEKMHGSTISEQQ